MYKTKISDIEQVENEFNEARMRLLELDPTGDDINASILYEILIVFKDKLIRFMHELEKANQ